MSHHPKFYIALILYLLDSKLVSSGEQELCLSCSPLYLQVPN